MRDLDNHIKNLQRNQSISKEEFIEAIEALKPLLNREKIRRVLTETIIFTNVGKGVIAHCPVLLRNGNIKSFKDINRPGCILITTIPLLNTITQESLKPGTYLVKIRSTVTEEYVFDFLDSSGTVLSSFYATPEAPPENFMLRIGWPKIDVTVVIHVSFPPARVSGHVKISVGPYSTSIPF